MQVINKVVSRFRFHLYANHTISIRENEYLFNFCLEWKAIITWIMKMQIAELMDWGFNQQNLPVIIKYPEMVAQIYPHFERNTLPEFARKSLWFL
jgi:hypothetical protein